MLRINMNILKLFINILILNIEGDVMSGKTITQEKEEAIIKCYKQGLSYKDIKHKLNTSESTIKKILEKNNIQIRKGYKKCIYNCNVHYLDELDTQDKNYFLGFFSADGYNSESKNEIILELQEQDSEFLQHLNNLFDNKRPMRTIIKKMNGKEYKQSRICIHGKELCQKLKEYNCCQNKTFNYEIPSFYLDGTNHFIKDFVRGYLDADGCIYYDKQTQKIKINICCNYKVSNQFYTILQNELNITPILYAKNDKIWYIEIKKQSDIIKFCNWIYSEENCLCLYRKKEKFLNFINK